VLRDRFDGKIFVAGFSCGATFAAYAAVRRPELVAALVAVGMDIDIPAAEDNAYVLTTWGWHPCRIGGGTAGSGDVTGATAAAGSPRNPRVTRPERAAWQAGP